jgi:hypothetical protein
MQIPLVPPNNLEQQCLAQIERETAFLTALEAMAAQLREAIGASATNGWSAALRLQEEMARQAAETHIQRQQWRAGAATTLGIAAEQVTLTMLAARFGEPAKAALLAGRDRLRGQLAAIARLNGFNLLLVRAHLEALRRFVLDLTGGAAPARYNRAGTCAGTNLGCLVQTKG